MRKSGWEKLLQVKWVCCSDYAWCQITDHKCYIRLCFLCFVFSPILYIHSCCLWRSFVSLGHRREGSLHTSSREFPSLCQENPPGGRSKIAAQKQAEEMKSGTFVDGGTYLASGKGVVVWASEAGIGTWQGECFCQAEPCPDTPWTHSLDHR